MQLVAGQDRGSGDEAGDVRRRQGGPHRGGPRRRARRARTCARTTSAGSRPTRPARRFALADVRLRAPIIPKKFFHTAGNFREHHEESKNVNWSHPVLPWIVFFQNIDAIIGPDDDIVYPPARAHQRDGLRARAGGRDRQGRQVLLARGGRGLHRRLPDLQRHHRARHPARGDEVGRVQPLQGRSTRSARSARGSSRPTRSATRTNLAMELRVNGESRQESHTSRMSVTIPEIISHYSPMGYSPGRHPLDRHGVRRGRLQRRPDVAVPQARRRRRVRDREGRRAAQPRRGGRRARAVGARCAGTSRTSPRSGPASSARRSTPSS